MTTKKNRREIIVTYLLVTFERQNNNNNNNTMHPLVRNLYKRVLTVGCDYPTGINHVKEKFKKAILDTNNCPSCYRNRHVTKNNSNNNSDHDETVTTTTTTTTTTTRPSSTVVVIDYKACKQCEEEILFAVNKGRWYVKEMIGVIQLKKYRTMKQRYGNSYATITTEIDNRIKNIETSTTNNNNNNSNQ